MVSQVLQQAAKRISALEVRTRHHPLDLLHAFPSTQPRLEARRRK